jgi:hypothetical protein
MTILSWGQVFSAVVLAGITELSSRPERSVVGPAVLSPSTHRLFYLLVFLPDPSIHICKLISNLRPEPAARQSRC